MGDGTGEGEAEETGAAAELENARGGPVREERRGRGEVVLGEKELGEVEAGMGLFREKYEDGEMYLTRQRTEPKWRRGVSERERGRRA